MLPSFGFELREHYGAMGQEEWQNLLMHFEMADGFAFIVLEVPDLDCASICRRELDRYLAMAGKKLATLSTRGVNDLEVLADTLLGYNAPAKSGALWVCPMISRYSPEFTLWKKSWKRGVALLNQYRNPLTRQISIPLLFVGQDWMSEALKRMAPDLWSIRTLFIRIDSNISKNL